MTDQMYSSDIQSALDVARALARTGVPIFLLEPDPNAKTGYRTPARWQTTRPDPAVIDRWKPGMAIAAVCGLVFDVIDIDPRHGGTERALEGAIQVEYARAATPSGGLHLWIKSLGLRKSQGFIPGIDYQGGDDKGRGRGFVFIPPTTRVSKETGNINPYTWVSPPSNTTMSRLMTDGGSDVLRSTIMASTTSTKGNESSDLSITQKGTLGEQIGVWITEGAAPGQQHVALTRTVWDSLYHAESEAATRLKWQAIVDNSPQDQSDPWTDRHFREHYDTAASKLRDEGHIYFRVQDTEYQWARNIVEDGKRRIELITADASKMQAVDWLWEDRLALGSLALLGGGPGSGKSTFSYRLAAMITKGELLGDLHNEPRDVLISSSEDDFNRVIVPRLKAADADLSKVHQILAVQNQMHSDIYFPHDLEQFGEVLERMNPALTILDPLISRLGSSINTHKDSEVRQGLEPLVKLIEERQTAILGLIHFNKSGTSNALDAIMGSKAFTALARSVHLIFPDDEVEKDDEENKGRRIFRTEKNNLGPDGDGLPGFQFFIRTATVGTDFRGKEIKTSKLEYAGEDHRSSRELIQASKEAGKSPRDGDAHADKKTLCMMWLRALLEAHDRATGLPKETIVNEALAASHSKGTLNRAILAAQEDGWLDKYYPVSPGPWFYFLTTEGN